MNERNVAALARAIRSVTGSFIHGATLSAEQWAEELAAQGVLVPSAISDEQAITLNLRPAALRAVLERIAKGHAVGHEFVLQREYDSYQDFLTYPEP